MSGVTRQSYAPDIRIIRLMCTGRVDLAFILRAFSGGADGVIIGGCWPGECHYVTEGNYDALGNMHLGKKLLGHIGIHPDRLRLEWISASEGSRFAEVMSDFSTRISQLGPLGEGEGIDGQTLKMRLKVVSDLVPYIKLVERERLRLPVKSEQAYNAFFASDEADRLFGELIASKLLVGQILLHLREKPMSAGELAGVMGLNPSDVSRQLNNSSRQGLVRYDVELKRYAIV